MKKLLTLLMCLLLGVSPVLAEQTDVAMQQARDALDALGYPVSDEAAVMALEQHRMMQEMYAQWDMLPSDDFGSQSDWAYQLLLCEGVGEYDYDAMIFTPTSDRVYAFDAEFFNIEGMYTEFLQGVQAIVPEANITAVREDLSGMNEYLEGERKVFFECNGHAYVKTLKSEGDWLNGEIIDFVNQVLEVEGFDKQLHTVSNGWDQMVLLICGTEAEAAELRLLLGVEAPQEDNSLLDWLSDLLGL